MIAVARAAHSAPYEQSLYFWAVFASLGGVVSAYPIVAAQASCGCNAEENALFPGSALNFSVASTGFAGIATVRAYLTPKHRGNAGPEH